MGCGIGDKRRCDDAGIAFKLNKVIVVKLCSGEILKTRIIHAGEGKQARICLVGQAQRIIFADHKAVVEQDDLQVFDIAVDQREFRQMLIHFVDFIVAGASPGNFVIAGKLDQFRHGLQIEGDRLHLSQAGIHNVNTLF